jgi:hypothetical protein
MNSHMDEESGLFHLAADVGSVRGPANRSDKLEALCAKIDAGMLSGPRIQAMGFIEGRSPFSARHGFVVDNLDAAKRSVDCYAERDAIEIGTVADLLLADGDPSKSMSDILKASPVVRGGVAHAPARGFEALGIRPFVAATEIVSAPPAPN